MPPMMPLIHDALWLGIFAGLALFAWQLAERFGVRLSALDMRWPSGWDGQGASRSALSAWSTAVPARSSGNTAFDAWRDGEIAKIEAQRRVIETRLQSFEAFLDKLSRAADRATFERFMAEHHEAVDSIDAGVS